MIGLDTNVLVRWLIGDEIDLDQPRAQALLAGSTVDQGGPLFVNIVVFAETIWILVRRMRQPKSRVREVVAKMLDAANLVIDQRRTIELVVEQFEKGPADFADYLIAELNRQAGCITTMTFDKTAAKSPAFTRLAE
ncbi:MAG: type II toxin-antitoxin system VapC family toxin [Bauldia sp.]|nr:type II toxin-antitoxin system VapC family toxin [Bauldia sp.]